MFQYDAELIQRVCRQIDTHQLALLVQPFYVAPADLRLRNGRRLNLYAAEVAEERVLCLLLLELVALSETHQRVEERLALAVLHEEVLAPYAKRVESAAQRQRLEGFLVDGAEVDALDEVEDVLIGAVLLALVDDGLCHTVAHALDGCQAEAYLAMMVHTELLIRLVDVRSERSNAHLLALVHQLGDFGYLVASSRHDGSHELCRVVSLQIGCLVGHPRVAGSVRLVEGV